MQFPSYFQYSEAISPSFTFVSGPKGGHVGLLELDNVGLEILVVGLALGQLSLEGVDHNRGVVQLLVLAQHLTLVQYRTLFYRVVSCNFLVIFSTVK